MKKYKLIIVAIFSAFFFTACGCCTKVECSKPNQDGIYNLVVSFYSRGSGFDSNIYHEFNDYLSKIEKKEKKISVETYSWGREGEKDICLNFLCLKKEEKAKILSDLKEITSKSKLVHVYENETCKRKK